MEAIGDVYVVLFDFGDVMRAVRECGGGYWKVGGGVGDGGECGVGDLVPWVVDLIIWKQKPKELKAHKSLIRLPHRSVALRTHTL